MLLDLAGQDIGCKNSKILGVFRSFGKMIYEVGRQLYAFFFDWGVKEIVEHGLRYFFNQLLDVLVTTDDLQSSILETLRHVSEENRIIL